MMASGTIRNKISTFKTSEFLNRFMEPDPALEKLIWQNSDRFFIFRVQDMIKLSKLPVPPTRAETHLLIYLTSGTARMKIGFEEVQIWANECLIVPAGKVFSYQKFDSNEGYICSFGSDFLIGKIGNSELISDMVFLNVWGYPIIRPDSKIAPFLHSAFERILQEFDDNGPTNNQIVQSHLIAALCEINSAYRSPATTSSKTAFALTSRFRELLQKHLTTKHTVAEYAALLHVSPNHLNKTVKSVTTKSPSTLIGESLVNEGKVMLLQTNIPVNTIASNLGLYDQSYFSRLFKKYEGVTPQQFRKMIDMS